jgi:hypothetical protein
LTLVTRAHAALTSDEKQTVEFTKGYNL